VYTSEFSYINRIPKKFREFWSSVTSTIEICRLMTSPERPARTGRFSEARRSERLSNDRRLFTVGAACSSYGLSRLRRQRCAVQRVTGRTAGTLGGRSTATATVGRASPGKTHRLSRLHAGDTRVWPALRCPRRNDAGALTATNGPTVY